MYRRLLTMLLVFMVAWCDNSDDATTSSPAPSKIALLIVNVQQCFMPGQPMGPPMGAHNEDVRREDHVDLSARHLEIPHQICRMRREHDAHFELVVLSQDWHCRKDVAWTSQHTGSRVGNTVELQYNKRGDLCRTAKTPDEQLTVPCRGKGRNRQRLNQTLWPEHCVERSANVQLNANLTACVKDSDIKISKNRTMCHVDTYSAFEHNTRRPEHQTKLDEILKKNNINVVFITGMFLENAVYNTALGARERNYSTYLVIDAIGNKNYWTMEPALYGLQSKEVKVIESGDLTIIFKNMKIAVSGNRAAPTARCWATTMAAVMYLAWRVIGLQAAGTP